MKSLLGFWTKGKDNVEGGERYQPGEDATSIRPFSGLKKVDIGPENDCFNRSTLSTDKPSDTGKSLS